MLFLLLAAGCLFPLVVYFLILSIVNRQRRPLLVPGTRDLAGVLFAASGFLIFGAAGILIGFNDLIHSHSAPIQSEVVADSPMVQMSEPVPPSATAQFFSLVRSSSVLWMSYLVLVLGGTTYLLWRQRFVTSVYCVDAEEFNRTLAQVLTRQGLPWERRDNDVLLPPLEGENRLVHIASSPKLHHVTMHWDRLDPTRRREIEHDLATSLASVQTAANPLAGWFLGIASVLLVLTFGLAALALLTRIIELR